MARVLKAVPSLCRADPFSAAHAAAVGPAEASKTLDQVARCEEKLEHAEAKIYTLLDVALPTIRVPLPRLAAASFAQDRMTTKGSGYEQVEMDLYGAEEGEHPADRSLCKRAASHANQVYVWIVHHFAWLKYAAFAAVISLALALALALSGLQARLATLIASILGTAINFVCFAWIWRGRALKIFGTLEGVFVEINKKLEEILDATGRQLSQPLDELGRAIDDLVAEQVPAVRSMQQFESRVRKVHPDFQVPAPGDLKRPLDACCIYLDRFVQDTKNTVPEDLTELVGKHPLGKLALQRRLFNAFIVYLPLACILGLDLFVLWRSQVDVSARDMSDKSTGTGPGTFPDKIDEVDWPFAHRSLRGLQAALMPVPHHGSCDQGLRQAGIAASCQVCSGYYDARYDSKPDKRCQYVPGQNLCYPAFWVAEQGLAAVTDCSQEIQATHDWTVKEMPEDQQGRQEVLKNGRWIELQPAFTEAHKLPSSKSIDLGQLASVLTPVAVQVLLTGLQLVAGLLLTRSGWICSAANRTLSALEQELSERLAGRTGEVADKVFDKAFGKVRGLADSFFPEFRLRLSQLRTTVTDEPKAARFPRLLGSVGGEAEGKKANGVSGRVGGLLAQAGSMFGSAPATAAAANGQSS